MARLAFLDRILPRRGGSGYFAAVAGPNGLQVVEYRRERGGLVLAAGVRQEEPASDARSLAESLASAIAALGGRGGELSLALNGFGTAHHILALPPADEEILQPIVRRELLRYYPDLDDPVIGFVPAVGGDGAPGKEELLVGAVPRRLAVGLSRALAERNIVLRHLTVLPQVLQSLHDTFGAEAAPAVMVLVLESGNLLGCFHGGALRLFIEPSHDVSGRPVRDPDSVTEQVERAKLFLRQQYPNTRAHRVLLAAPPDEVAALRAALEDRLGSDVTELADIPPGPLAALGAALAADQDRGLQLLPAEVRPRTPAAHLTRRLAMVGAVLIALAGLWWSGAAMVVARTEADRAHTVERELTSLLPQLNRASEVLEARQAHRLRLVFMEETASVGAEVRQIMAGVAAEARPAIELGRLTVERGDVGWRVSLSGRAVSSSSAGAVRAIDALYRGISSDLPVTEARFGGMEAMPGETDAPVAIGFDMSFIVLWQTNLAR